MEWGGVCKAIGSIIAMMRKMKNQGPTSKHQRNHKLQAPRPTNGVDGVAKYPEISSGAFVLNDAPNYCEANEAVSKKEFKCIIGRCVKEAKETKFFLRMIATSEPTLADEARRLYREAKELHLIFASIFRK